MSDVEIVALRCPSCGNASNVPERELMFGYQFTCPYCKTVSVLIVNRLLYIPSPGEKICIKCGRVGPQDARFCQCGASLVRTCINPKCRKEFPIHHNLCDYCGWPQDVKRAISDLSNPDPEIQEKACKALVTISPNAPEAVPALADLIKHSENPDVIVNACEVLKAIGPAASEAVPALVDLIRYNERWEAIKSACDALGAIGSISETASALTDLIGRSKDKGVIIGACGVLKTIGPAASQAAPTLADLIRRSEDPDVIVKACEVLKAIGPAASEAVPALADLIRRSENQYVIERACWALKAIGPAASEAVPALADLIRRSEDLDVTVKACEVLMAIGPKASEAVPVLVDLIKRSKSRTVIEAACQTLKGIGPAALPALRSLTGWFSPLDKDTKNYIKKFIAEMGVKERRAGLIWLIGGLMVLALVFWLVRGGNLPIQLQQLSQPFTTRFATPQPTATRTSVVTKPTRVLPTPTPKPTRVLPTPTPEQQLSKQACPRPEVCITYPQMNATLRGAVQFRGTATRPNFDYYKFEFKPEGAKDWSFLVRFNKPVVNGILMEWHTNTVPPGAYWLRLIVVDKSGNYWPEFAEIRVIVADQGQRP